MDCVGVLIVITGTFVIYFLDLIQKYLMVVIIKKKKLCVLMLLQLFLLKEMIIEFIFLHISKDEAINLLRNADLTEKSGKW